MSDLFLPRHADPGWRQGSTLRPSLGDSLAAFYRVAAAKDGVCCATDVAAELGCTAGVARDRLRRLVEDGWVFHPRGVLWYSWEGMARVVSFAIREKYG